MITLESYILLAVVLFFIGAIGVVVRRNILVVFMCIELMLNAVNLMLVAFSKYNLNLDGQIIVFFIMVVAACEVAVGLAIVISVFRHFEILDSSWIKNLKG